jgi:transcription-repair coupling factor (superfamily II helicase)
MDETVWDELALRIRASEPYDLLRARLGRAERLPVAAAAWIVGLLAAEVDRRLLVLVPHEAEVLRWNEASELFGLPTEVFPAPSLTPYHETTPSVMVRAQEVVTLERLSGDERSAVVCTPRALFRRLPSREEFSRSVVVVERGTTHPLETLTAHLMRHGYSRRDLVTDLGEFAVRGGVLDCFPPGSEWPLRIDFFGDTVESIRAFDPADQRSRKEIAEARLLPLTLFARGQAMERLAEILEARSAGEVGYEAMQQLNELSRGQPFPGWENHLPLLADVTLTLPDWIGAGALCVGLGRDSLMAEVRRHSQDLQTDFKQQAEAHRLAVPPELLEHPQEIVQSIVDQSEVWIGDSEDSGGGRSADFGVGMTDLFHQQLPRFPREVETARERKERLLVVADREHRGRIEQLCNHYGLQLGHGGVEFVEGQLERGFRLPAAGVVVFSEAQLFRRPQPSRRRREVSGPSLSSLRDLRIGDYVVHEDHGIGQFVGLQNLRESRADRPSLPPVLSPEVEDLPAAEVEVLEIRYDGDRALLLPPSRLDLIQRYAGFEGVEPRLDRLGGTSWTRTKERVRAGMQRLAGDLLRLYAERQVAEAPAMPEDSDLQRHFEMAFDYEETADQLEAVEAIKRDLESRQPMDRLLCGDVGFGKTEVAMRVAFKAVDGGYQVALLAPTTILADQHLDTFRERFAGFPVEIEMVSRFRTPAQVREIRERLEEGRIDILIGTHRLLSEDIRIPNLGLLIVDEEQRFGVAQKERLKELKKSVHVLAMTATPVPRTLQLSLVGVRDMSTIETAPRDRMAVETAIMPFSVELIREAVEYELDRGGQVYFVYNRVAGISGMAKRLREICERARLIVGHGQMGEMELARRMHAFKRGEHNLLLATTIIENGIDIPNVNTIIVHRADRFGLAQLYQLRGRVGRSSQLAYCYLLTPADRVLSETSRKRLEAIREFTELGAGFRVAARDLEIRGAGDLLGAEQSGHIAAVGLETYLKMLEETVRTLRGEEVPGLVSTAMNLPVELYIPTDYVSDANLRMEIYKKIAAAETEEHDLLEELRDRFGSPPKPVLRLLEVSALRRRAESLRIQSISAPRGKLQIRFRRDTPVSAETLTRFVGEESGASFSPTGVLTLGGLGRDQVIAHTREVLERLSS